MRRIKHAELYSEKIANTFCRTKHNTTDDGTIDPSCNMPTPTILCRRGSNMRFHKDDEMTPAAHKTYRPGSLFIQDMLPQFKFLLTQSVISTSICYFHKFLFLSLALMQLPLSVWISCHGLVNASRKSWTFTKVCLYILTKYATISSFHKDYWTEQKSHALKCHFCFLLYSNKLKFRASSITCSIGWRIIMHEVVARIAIFEQHVYFNLRFQILLLKSGEI